MFQNLPMGHMVREVSIRKVKRMLTPTKYVLGIINTSV
jgi:hypothetical protein